MVVVVAAAAVVVVVVVVVVVEVVSYKKVRGACDLNWRKSKKYKSKKKENMATDVIH